MLHDILTFLFLFLGENITLKTQNVQVLFTFLALQIETRRHTQIIFLTPASECLQ